MASPFVTAPLNVQSPVTLKIRGVPPAVIVPVPLTLPLTVNELPLLFVLVPFITSPPQVILYVPLIRFPPEFIITSVEEVGTAPPHQFEPVPQSVFVVPVIFWDLQ